MGNFLNILSHLTEILETKRLTVVVTRFDSFYESSDDESDGDEITEIYDVKERVCQQLQDALKPSSLAVSHELIILVSGKWALEARKTTHTEENVSRLNKHLVSYSKKASKKAPPSYRAAGTAESLLTASGIKELEKR